MNDELNTSVNEGADGAQEEIKAYTQEEVLALLQSESDKRVTAALKKQQAKYEKQLSLSKLDGAERERAEKDSRIAEKPPPFLVQVNPHRNQNNKSLHISVEA